MANKAISELPQAQNVNNQDLFVLEQGGLAKKLTAETFITEQGIIDALAEALDGHGGIQSVTLSSVSGRIRTYRITFTDQSATTFQVYDGTSIDRISRTSSSGLDDVYTIFLSDGTTTFFTVHNGADGTVSEAMLNDALKDKAPAITETTESSVIATFSDGADDMVMHHVVAEINPVQSGSGDPSPDNIRPISGWTGCNVQRTGKNLLKPTAKTTGIITENADGSVVINGTSSGTTWLENAVTGPQNAFELKAGTYRLSGGVSSSIQLYGVYSYDDFTTRGEIAHDTGNGATFTLINDAKFYLQVQVSASTYVNQMLYPQIELGTSTTSYEPYNGSSLSLSWQTEAGTVYGGTIDVATGLLTVNKAIVDLGTLTWERNTSYTNAFFSSSGLSRRKPASWMISSNYPLYNKAIGLSSAGVNLPNKQFAGHVNTTLIFIRDDSYDNASSFKTAMSGVQLCYELATAQSYLLTGQQLMTLLGTNNVWADTGNTSVTYTADTKMFIGKLTMPTEDDLVANQAITSGKYFMIGNSLYLALANIASGAQITIGTNAQRVSLADALNTINS